MKEYQAILHSRVVPFLGQIALQALRPVHMDQSVNALRSPKGTEGRSFSPHRMNLILLRVRSFLDLGRTRGGLQPDPHRWVALQPERRPDVDPFSFEERMAFLKVLP